MLFHQTFGERIHHDERHTRFCDYRFPTSLTAGWQQDGSVLPWGAEPLTYLLQHSSPALLIAACAITCAEKLKETVGHRAAITSFPDETAALMDQCNPSSLTVSPLGTSPGHSDSLAGRFGIQPCRSASGGSTERRPERQGWLSTLVQLWSKLFCCQLSSCRPPWCLLRRCCAAEEHIPMGSPSGDAKQTTHKIRVSMAKPCPSSLCLPRSGVLGAAVELVSPTEACLGGSCQRGVPLPPQGLLRWD